MKAKLGGLRHIYVYYLGKPALPCECPSFEEGVVHISDPALMAAIKSNQTSCISSGCHQTVHDVATLKDQKFWNGGN